MKIYLASLALLLLPAAAHAQRQCRRGIPCGNTCIAANRTCHVGTAAPADTSGTMPTKSQTGAARPLVASTQDAPAPWVASAADGVYFVATCTAAQDLAPANRRYFSTEAEAQRGGYRRSRTPGC